MLLDADCLEQILPEAEQPPEAKWRVTNLHYLARR